jgi:hypothetical protein
MWKQPCQLRDSNFAGDTPGHYSQCDFVERELEGFRHDQRGSLMDAASASGEVSASEHCVGNGICRRACSN